MVDENGVVRIVGTLTFTDPVNQPAGVGVVLSAAAIDVHAAQAHAVSWNAAFDNAVDFNSIAAVPPGLGMSFKIDGSSPTFTVTSAGVWTYEFQGVATSGADAGIRYVLFPNATLQGQVLGPIATVGGSVFSPSVFGTFQLAVGDTFQFNIVTEVAATANPYYMTPFLVLARTA
jgi:hypothetical protein